MESIGKECTDLKKSYDECFNYWFSEKYLKGDTRSNICGQIFKEYQNCVREAVKKQNIDLKHLEKNVLGTEEEKTNPVKL